MKIKPVKRLKKVAYPAIAAVAAVAAVSITLSACEGTRTAGISIYSSLDPASSSVSSCDTSSVESLVSLQGDVNVAESSSVVTSSKSSSEKSSQIESRLGGVLPPPSNPK